MVSEIMAVEMIKVNTSKEMSGGSGSSSAPASGGGGGGGGGNQISLQILPSGQALSMGGNSAGGPVGEWAEKITALGCIAASVMVLIGAALGVAGTALYYVYGDDSNVECIGTIDSISFSYITWMKIMGLSFIGGFLFELVLVVIHGTSGTVCTSKVATWFGIFLYVAQLAWGIVGAILYWRTVFNDCDKESSIGKFSLALFVIETAILMLLICGRKAAQYA